MGIQTRGDADFITRLYTSDEASVPVGSRFRQRSCSLRRRVGQFGNVTRLAEDRLNGPEFRRGIESAIEDRRRIRAHTRDDVLPQTWQSFRGIRTEEVAERGLAESVEMFVSPKKR